MKVLALSLLWIGLAAASATFEELAAQAAAARDANRLPQAVDLYKQALQLNPKWPEGWWSLGALYYDSDQYPNCQDAFQHLTRLDESAAPAWSFLGLCEFETGRYPESLDHIEHGLRLSKGLDAGMQKVLRFHEALLLTRAGLFDRALPLYIPLARGGSQDPTLIAAMGLTALRRPMLPNEVPPAQKDLVMTAGKTACAWVAGDSAAAEAGFQALLANFSAAPSIHYFLGTYLLAAHPEQAVTEFQRELVLNPHAAHARAMLAFLMMRAGQESAALPYARRAAEDGPDTPMARYVCGLLLTHAGDRAGIPHLEAAEQLDPDNFEYHMALAGAYSRFGRYADARRERQASIVLAKEPGESH